MPQEGNDVQKISRSYTQACREEDLTSPSLNLLQGVLRINFEVKDNTVTSAYILSVNTYQFAAMLFL